MGFWKFIQRRGREAKNFENCVFVIQFAPNLGKPAFLILSRENMGVPWPGDQEKHSKVGKLKNLGFPHFPYYIEPSLLSPHRGAYCMKNLSPGLGECRQLLHFERGQATFFCFTVEIEKSGSLSECE